MEKRGKQERIKNLKWKLCARSAIIIKSFCCTRKKTGDRYDEKVTLFHVKILI